MSLDLDTLQLDTLERAYQALVKDHDLPAMRQERIEIEAQRYADPAQVWKRIEAFQPTMGWLCFQSSLQEIQGGTLPTSDEATGWLLSAECVNGKNASLHLRQDDRGGWLITEFRPDQGDSLLWDAVCYLAHDPAQAPQGEASSRRPRRGLHYRRYWRLDPKRGMVQHAARLVAIDPEEPPHA